jgi:farnesyl diphosphate synthase
VAAIDLKQALSEVAEDINQTLDKLLPPAEGSQARVFEAMRHSALAGGKRLRPFLAVASADLFDVPRGFSNRAGVAVELIHTYSLVHDDLPAMDDDDLRRGRPTCHKMYDEATAILVGDGLQSLAFEILADDATHHDPRTRCQLVQALAVAAGGHGMVGGQMIDLSAPSEDYDVGAITRLQQLKTGALIAVSCEMGAILGHATEECRQALRGYAHALGLAFQIADDLLDHEGSEEDMGKAVGKDVAAGKATFVSLLGVERARTQARMLTDQAVAHLDHFGQKAGLLQEAARYVVERKS